MAWLCPQKFYFILKGIRPPHSDLILPEAVVVWFRPVSCPMALAHRTALLLPSPDRKFATRSGKQVDVGVAKMFTSLRSLWAIILIN